MIVDSLKHKLFVEDAKLVSLRCFLKTALGFMMLLLIGTTLLVCAYAIPEGVVKSHASSAQKVFEDQWTWERIIPGLETTRKDNFSDAIMLSEVCYSGPESVLAKSLHNYYYRGVQSDGSLELPDKSLVKYLNDEESLVRLDYSRYWHGYIVLLKPLLVFFTYQDLILLNYILLGSLGILLLGMTYTHYGFRVLVGVVLFFIFATFFVVPSCLQFAAVFYIAIGLSLIVIRWGHKIVKRNDILPLAFFAGCITSYFDLLTAPTLTLTVPLCFLIIELISSGNKKSTRIVFLYCLSWAAGYVAMWAVKWIIASLILGENLMPWERLRMRSSGVVEGVEISFIGVFAKNVSVFASRIYILCTFFLVIYLFVIIIKNHGQMKPCWQSTISCLIVCAIPFVWYIITQNHAYIHFWMTYRNLAVLPLGFILGIMYGLGLPLRNNRGNI